MMKHSASFLALMLVASCVSTTILAVPTFPTVNIDTSMAAIAPALFKRGSKFVTAPCETSSECQTLCCQANTKQCRNVPAIATTNPVTGKFDLSTGQKQCIGNEDGKMSGGGGAGSGGGETASTAPAAALTSGGSGGDGSAAPSGAKVCLDAGCKSTTGVDGCSPSSGTQFVTGKCSQSTECASGCCVGDLGVCRNVLALNQGVGGLARCTGNTNGLICTK